MPLSLSLPPSLSSCLLLRLGCLRLTHERESLLAPRRRRDAPITVGLMMVARHAAPVHRRRDAVVAPTATTRLYRDRPTDTWA